MASNVKSQSTNRQATRVQSYVDSQLEKTRRQVKSYELIVSFLIWAVAVATFFLVLSLIDGWIFPLSTTWRWIALATLILGSVTWFLMGVMPLFLRKINLDYAAHMIEQASPNVKNSLLNYSLLRKRNETMNAAVMDAVSRQAAEQLNTIPNDSTIDRSRLIRVGFVLVGVMVFAVAYKLISPRDPLQTVQRILFPGQLIAQPASVQISDVTPGSTDVFFGDPLRVTARVKGPHQPEDVRLLVSSSDGQITDQSIPMELDETGRSYECLISPDNSGIQQPLTYRIEARDGVTPEFNIHVKANPAIAIEAIELTPPTYTGLPKRTLNGRGDIEAIEGTEAMIFAVANLPIKVAYMELLNAVPDDDPQNPNATIMKPAAPPIEMRLLPENRASGRFSVSLNSNRTRPRATHYQIRFVGSDDERNETPNVYPIRVIPDLAPEVRVVHPRSRQSNLAVNGKLPIRIEANDLDFAIDSVVLNMDHQGSQLVRKTLELNSDNGNQRVTCQFAFEPARYRLRPGDQVMFHAVAADNRISIKSLAPDPNISQTENFTVTIVEADPEQDQSPPDREPSENQDDPADSQERIDEDSQDNQTSKDGGEQDSGDQSEEGQESEENGSTSQQPSEENRDSGESNDGSGEQEQEGSTDQNRSGNQNQSEAEGRNERQNDGTSERGNPEGSSEGGGTQGQGDDSQSDGSATSSDANEGGSPDGSDSQGPSGANQDDPDARASDQPNQDGATGSQSNEGARSNPDGTADSEDGTRDKTLTDGQRERLPDDAHDGEKFEKLDELLKDQQPSDRSSGKQQERQGSDRPDNQPADNGSGQQGSDDSNRPDDQSGGASDRPSPEQKTNDDNRSEGEQSGNKREQPSAEGKPGEQSQKSENPEGSENEAHSPSSSGESSQSPEQQGENSGGSDDSSGSSGSSDQGESNQPSNETQPQAGGETGASQSGQPGENPSQSADANSSGESGEPGDGVTRSGEQSGGAGSDQPSSEQLEKEQADLEHAKKATDLILNKLEDQQQNPDPDLLDKMNWSEQDLREFLDRWKRMKQNAQSGDPDARKQYEEAIKSLGLRPDNNSRTSKNRDADASGLNQDSSVIEPPADLAPDFNEFLRDRNRVR